MWPANAFTNAYENLLAHPGNDQTKPMKKGLIQNFHCYKRLCLVSIYLDVLEKTREASKIFECEDLLPFAVKPIVDMTLAQLDHCIDDVEATNFSTVFWQDSKLKTKGMATHAL